MVGKVRDVNQETSIFARGRTVSLIDYADGTETYNVSPALEWEYDSKSLGRTERVLRDKIRLKKGDLQFICNGLTNGDAIQKGRKYAINREKFVELLKERFNIEYDPRTATNEGILQTDSEIRSGDPMDVLFEGGEGSVDLGSADIGSADLDALQSDNQVGGSGTSLDAGDIVLEDEDPK